MKAIYSVKSLIVLTLVALGLTLGATPSQAEWLGSDAEIVIRSTGNEATFDYAYINFENWKHQESIYGMPRRQDTIAKGDHITLSNTSKYDGFVTLSFTQEDDGKIRIDFPKDLLSKRNPDDGCGNGGFWATGCDSPTPGEIFGVGFLGRTQERIYSENPALFKAEGMKIYFRPTADSELIPLEDDGSSAYVIHSMTQIKVKVEGYNGPQVPGPESFSDNEEITELDSNDYLSVALAYNLNNPDHSNMVDQDDQKLTVTYLDGGVQKSETYPLGGAHEFRIYGPQQDHVRAKASVAFADDLIIEAEAEYSAFTKIEYWTTGATPQLVGTFNKGKVTKIHYHAYSASFSRVEKSNAANPGGQNFYATPNTAKITSGDTLTVRQEGSFLAIRTSEPFYKKDTSTDGFLKPAEGGGNPPPVPGLVWDDGQDDEDEGEGPAINPQEFGNFTVDSWNLGGGGCSLSIAGNGSLINLWGLLALALPMLIHGIRRK